jgi:hypothetical protein
MIVGMRWRLMSGVRGGGGSRISFFFFFFFFWLEVCFLFLGGGKVDGGSFVLDTSS